MRLHVLGLPHTETTRDYLHCAYTQKVLKFCDMMSRAHEVILYAGERNEARCSEHVPLVSSAERRRWFGEWDANNLFEAIDWDPAAEPWRLMNARAFSAIRERAEPRDTLCLVTSSQAPVAHALPWLMPVEWAVGYEGVRLERRVFESYAWMHHIYGKRGIDDGAAFDAVIPNFFDPADFARDVRAGGDYLLYLGRLVARKGPHVAALIAERVGMPLLVAGPGASRAEPGRIICPEIEIRGERIEYVGPVDVSERAELLAGAAATLVPTQYIEPFGGVAVEAMLSGCPVVATDWGAFTETVQLGVSGFRFRTLAEGAAAVTGALALDRARVRDYARGRYALDAVYPLFDAHFRRLESLWADGWYA